MVRHVHDLDTPLPVIELPAVERNLARVQAHLAAHGIACRPHIKTHKAPFFAHRQLARGAVGITCQKLGEAEIMADAGIDDIFISYNILGAAKGERLRALAGRIRLSVACDNATVADSLAEAFAGAGDPLRVVVECDTGMGRCGVQSPKEAVELAQHLDRLPGVAFEGLMTFPATRGDPEKVSAFFDEARAGLAAAGLDCHRVTCGGTPNIWRAHEVRGVTEHRPGTYIFMDRSLMAAGVCELDDCALRIHATVVSRPAEDRAVVDAGSKSLTTDTMGLEGHGHVVEYPQAQVAKLSEEHGVLDLSACAGARPAVGERLSIVPNHACVVVNLFDQVAVCEDGRLVRELPVAARGRVR